jgi:hypothetical protein
MATAQEALCPLTQVGPSNRGTMQSRLAEMSSTPKAAELYARRDYTAEMPAQEDSVEMDGGQPRHVYGAQG